MMRVAPTDHLIDSVRATSWSRRSDLLSDERTSHEPCANVGPHPDERQLAMGNGCRVGRSAEMKVPVNVLPVVPVSSTV